MKSSLPEDAQMPKATSSARMLGQGQHRLLASSVAVFRGFSLCTPMAHMAGVVIIIIIIFILPPRYLEKGLVVQRAE